MHWEVVRRAIRLPEEAGQIVASETGLSSYETFLQYSTVMVLTRRYSFRAASPVRQCMPLEPSSSQGPLRAYSLMDSYSD